MKHHLRKVITIILVASILISCFSVVASAASGPTYTSSRDRYFSELEDNIPINAIGSCSYVAMSLMLSYYDVYWNDNFVPEKYEQNIDYTTSSSDGYSAIRTETQLFTDMWNDYKASGGPLGIKDFYVHFVDLYRNAGYLHLDLIGMGIDAGYYDGLLQNDEYGSTITETAYLLDLYFDNIFGSYNYYDHFGTNLCPGPISIKVMSSDGTTESHNAVIAKIHELLEDDILVMYRGEKVDPLTNAISAHRMIIYDAIKEGHEIVDCKIHTGLLDKKSTTAIESYTTLNTTSYNTNIAILWLEIDENQISHLCNDKYIGNTGEKYCACEIYGNLHKCHVHKTADGDDTPECHYGENNRTCVCGKLFKETHHFSLIYSDTQHWEQCACGTTKNISEHHYVTQTSDRYHWLICDVCKKELQKQEHLYNVASISPTKHLRECSCGVYYIELHNYIYRSYTDTGHYDECICGERTNIVAHTICRTSISDTSHIELCESCGYSVEKPHELSNFMYENSNFHKANCICGYTYHQGHEWHFVSVKYDVCAICNHARYRNGGIEETYSIIPEENDS